jgi:hypothetical protein
MAKASPTDEAHAYARVWAVRLAATVAVVVALGMLLYDAGVGEVGYSQLSAVRGDLRHLVEAQDSHFVQEGTYASDVAMVAFVASPGVRARVKADVTGWAAEVHYESERRWLGCALFVGQVEALPTVRGLTPIDSGEVVCDHPYFWWSPTRLLRN